jgi:anti-sigma regulatory factor (Ser/Thr protein kinase)
MGLNEDFLKFTKVFDALYEIGVTKDVAIDIVINELFDNASKYAGKLDVIEEMLLEKLTIDQYISLKNYKVF